MTHPHYLRGTERDTGYARQWFTVAGSTTAESEGDTMVHRLRSLSAVSAIRQPRSGKVCRESETFFAATTFWDWVYARTRRNCTPWVIVFNARWLMHLLEVETQVDTFGVEVLTNWDGTGPLFLRLAKPHPSGGRPLRLRVICHTNIWRGTSRSEMAASIPNLEEPVDWDHDTSTALTADVLSRMMEGWTQALVDGDFGALQPTVGRQAMAAVKRRVKAGELLVHGKPHAERLEREAYVGGRCEARPGRYEQVWEADIPSCYPTIMRENPMPGRLVESHETPMGGYLVPSLEDYLDSFLVIADVMVQQDVPAIPRRLEGGGADHPVGEPFRAALPTPWLQWALEHDAILSVGTILAYEPTEVLSSLMRDLVSARRGAVVVGNMAGAQTMKVMANAVHGKMGQRRRVWETVPDEPCPDRYWEGWFGPALDDQSATPQVYEWRWRDGAAQRLLRDEGGAESMVAISAHTSAHARLRLFTLMRLADEFAGPHGWVYADTDGLYVTESAKTVLERQGGDLRFSGPYDLHVIKRKQYRKDGRMVASGLPAGARQMSPELWETDRWPAWQLGATEERGRVRVHGQRWGIS